MRFLSIFSGIGGCALGLERAGMESVAFCEIAAFPRQVLRKHWPNVPIHDDVRTLDVSKIKADVYAGGFPCTQTSVAASIHGKRDGLEGKDSRLWYAFLQVVGEGRPSWVIIENPGGIKTWESEIQGGLEGFGYTVSRLALKASDFGLPHLRRRHFYVANRDGKRLEVSRQVGSPSVAWAERLTSDGGPWLSNTPGTCGSFNGVPNRVDRVKGLGNTVVPAMMEFVGRAVLSAENKCLHL